MKRTTPDKLTYVQDLDVLVFYRPGAKDWAVQITPHVDTSAWRIGVNAEPVHFVAGFSTFEMAEQEAKNYFVDKSKV